MVATVKYCTIGPLGIFQISTELLQGHTAVQLIMDLEIQLATKLKWMLYVSICTFFGYGRSVFTTFASERGGEIGKLNRSDFVSGAYVCLIIKKYNRFSGQVDNYKLVFEVIPAETPIYFTITRSSCVEKIEERYSGVPARAAHVFFLYFVIFYLILEVSFILQRKLLTYTYKKLRAYYKHKRPFLDYNKLF